MRSLFALLFVSVLFISCDPNRDCIKGEGESATRELAVDGFTSLDLGMDATVTLIPSNTYSVMATGQVNHLDLINLAVENGEWVIRLEDCIRKAEPISLEVRMPVPNTLRVSGSGSLTVMDTLVAHTLSAVVTGSGSLSVIANVNQMVAASAGSGEMTLTGIAEVLNASIGSSGSLNAFGLPVNNASVVSTGSGHAEVQVANSLDVILSGSGNVYYKGTPSIVSDISGSGEVIDAN